VELQKADQSTGPIAEVRSQIEEVKTEGRGQIAEVKPQNQPRVTSSQPTSAL